ncbi:MAG: hypothetical protein M3203_01125 [Actinomycetota bacterium]|nr:hypothetical protein [Actinomycetota bacterium]
MDGDRLDEDQIALVIRRASELDGQAPGGRPGLDLVLLEEAAVEAGLSRESVRRAVAELRAGALGAEPEATSVVSVSRCVPGPADAVDDILRQFLHKEQFQLRRDFGTRSTWGRRHDVPARVRISLDKSISRRLVLRPAEQVEIAVVEEPGDQGMVMVKIAVDVRPLRRARRATVGRGVGVGTGIGAVTAAVFGMPEALVLLPAAAASGGGVGHLVGSSRYQATVDELRTGLEGFLDSVERRPGRR